MNGGFSENSDFQLLEVISEVCEALTDDRLRLPTDTELMNLLLAGVKTVGRLQVWLEQLAGRIESSEAAWRAHKTSATSWLAEAANLTPKEARRMIKAGQELSRFTTVGAAAAAGSVMPAQAEAISSVLDKLPQDFDAATIREAEQLMVGFAATHNSAELRRLTNHLVEVLAPETVDQLEAERLERELTTARRNRFLEFHGDGQGSVLFRGSLPIADAEPFIRMIDAHAAQAKRGIDRLDPLAEMITPAQARADALITMVQRYADQSLAPVNGGDRPRLVVTLGYDKLCQQALDAGLVDPAGTITATGEPIAPSIIRQLLCDADLMPIVLGGPSQVLDEGRSQRLVTPSIKAALDVRDGGCVFPGCDKPPDACHAHHRRPWWAGGETRLANLHLLCPHHHAIVEPSHDPDEDRWQIRLRTDGVTEVIPPRRVDPTQRPRVPRPVHQPSGGGLTCGG